MINKKIEKNLKSEKAITLIALVITIIVLLILAGISLAMLSGENGILNRATDAKQNNDSAQIEERIKLAYTAALAKDSTKGAGNLTKETLEDELQKEFGENNYNVDDSDKDVWIIYANGQNITIPAGTKIDIPYFASEIYEVNGTTKGKMHIGDYVNYNVDYSNVFGDMYGAYGSPTQDKYAGKWRVLSVNGDSVEIVSAGIPLKYMFTTGTSMTEAVGWLSHEVFSIYLNKNAYTLRGQFTCHGFKDESGNLLDLENSNAAVISLLESANGGGVGTGCPRALTKADIDKATGQSGTSYNCASYFDGLFTPQALGNDYTPCWLGTEGLTNSKIMCITTSGAFSEDGSNVSKGIRLVIPLNRIVKYKVSKTVINNTQTWDIVKE